MAGDPAALRQALGLLNHALAEARRQAGAEARPSAGLLDEITRRAAEAKVALDRLTAGAGEVPEAERLELMREAAAARGRLAVVAKLAAGGARFASLVRELDGSPRGGLYGRGGAGGREAPASSVERKA
jgi:hypothetical protein